MPVHGVLLLDKAAGRSSNDVLVQAKRLLNAEKAGHTGTLDPFATGLLPLCFGEATKFAQRGQKGTLVADDYLGHETLQAYAPADIPVGIMTALVGAPFFIWLIRRAKVREL